jgi:SWI/SNF-related matrix-associated actin-dependent regulator 1 of chromatin subfamily A
MTTPTSRVLANSPLASANEQEAPRPADDRSAAAFSALMRGADAPASAAARAADPGRPDLGEILRGAIGPLTGPRPQAPQTMTATESPVSSALPASPATPGSVIEGRALPLPDDPVARHSPMPEVAAAEMPVHAPPAEPIASSPAEVHGPSQEVRLQGDMSPLGNLPTDPSPARASADPAASVPAARGGVDPASTSGAVGAPTHAAAAVSQAAVEQNAGTAAQASVPGATIASAARPVTMRSEADAAFAASELVRQTEAAQAADDAESIASADASIAGEAITKSHLEEEQDDALERPVAAGTGPVSASVASAILAVAQQQQAGLMTQRIHIELVNRPDSLPLEVLKSI